MAGISLQLLNVYVSIIYLCINTYMLEDLNVMNNYLILLLLF